MSKLNQVWIIASDKSAIAELTAGAHTLGNSVTLLLAGSRENAIGADTVYYFGGTGEKQTFLAYVPAMVQLAVEKKPDVILTDTSRNGRYAAAFLAAAFQTNAMTDVMEVWLEGTDVLTKRMVYGGSAFRIEKAAGTAVICAGAGVFAGAETAEAGVIEDAAASEAAGIVFKEKSTKTAQAVNLAAAKKIISVGRGLGDAANLPAVEAFAEKIGAEIGCSRPVAEEEKWMPKERYIGISGCMVKADVYVAAGISGQVQHMAGANQSKTIIAINKDSSAPVFSQCDYGIVGDLMKILPALTAKL